MKRDIVIDEIRAVRQAISARFGHNTQALLEHYRELEKLHAHRLLREEPEPVAAGSRKADQEA